MNNSLSLEDYAKSGISNELENYCVTSFTGLSLSEAKRDPNGAVQLAYEIVSQSYDIIGFQDDLDRAMAEVVVKARLWSDFPASKMNAKPGQNPIQS